MNISGIEQDACPGNISDKGKKEDEPCPYYIETL